MLKTNYISINKRLNKNEQYTKYKTYGKTSR